MLSKTKKEKEPRLQPLELSEAESDSNLGKMESEAVGQEKETTKQVSQESGEKVVFTRPLSASSGDQVAKVNELKNERQQNIERILEVGIEDYFWHLPVREQHLFKTKGEETARQIENLLTTAKATVQKIIELIKSWLGIAPRLNKWFIEQDSKIKAQKIYKMAKLRQ